MKASPHLASLLFGTTAAIASVAPSRLPESEQLLAPGADTIPQPLDAPRPIVLVGSDVGEVTLPPVSPPRTASGAPRDRFPSETILVTFAVRHENAPALIAALADIRNDVGERLVAPHSFAREDALTRAAKALAGLQAGLTHAGYTVADTDYR
jgi:hypothetical protein